MAKTTKLTGTLTRLPLTMAICFGLYGMPAIAQDTAADAEAEKAEASDKPREEEQVLNRIEVTGSLVRRLEYESTSPVQIISADTSAELGQLDTADMVQQSSVAAGSTQITNQFGGFVVDGGLGVQTLSLRGLGAQRTLSLLDGRRPGPAGVRGAVGAFDLNVIPSSILNRVELLKDGASSTYGSDAVAGVANFITRKSVDRPELVATVRAPFESGGEEYSVSGATGWNFDAGSVVAAFQWDKQEALKLGDRDYLSCAEDLFYDQDGNRIDREDRSIIGGTPLGGCSSGNLYANTVIDAVFGTRYIPSPDGVTIGQIPGYRPRGNRTYANAPQAYFEDVLNFDFMGAENVIDTQERMSFFASSDFTLGEVTWDTTLLLNRRTTENRGFRQFFPLIGGATTLIPGYEYANSPNFAAPVQSGIAQPVMPFRSDTDVEIDYVFLTSGLEGGFGQSNWIWQVNGSYSRSDGDYSNLGIVASRSGDIEYSDTAPTLDYFSPGLLSGAQMDQLVAEIGEWHTGNTVYDQKVISALATGDVWETAAGVTGVAIGLEHRRFSIDDNPSDLSQNGDLWGSSSAQVTKGSDHVTELFAEIDMPLLANLPGVESLTVNASARTFEYDTVGDNDHVWKIGVNWQIVPSLRFRATKGTSYRAPGLFELFLGDQTGFQSQLNIDPCIQWGESNSDFIRANCAALGIPANYAGAAASATITSSGGAGFLAPETSRATTAGIVFTPTFADFSISFDYFEMEVNDQITNLSAGTIVGGCYGQQVFPNNFCNLLSRNPADHPTAPFMITDVRSTYLNVDRQLVRGYDMLVRYERDFSWANMLIESQVTYTYEDIALLFSTAEASGFENEDRNGSIGRPKLVGNLRAAFERGDWTYSWFMNYVDGTKSLELSDTTTYFGFANAYRDIYAESKLYHGVSVRYDQGDWALLFGINNLMDEKPAFVSSGVDSRYGNVPVSSTQYDLLGRNAFARFTYKF